MKDRGAPAPSADSLPSKRAFNPLPRVILSFRRELLSRNASPVPSLCWRCQRSHAAQGVRCESCEQRAEAERAQAGQAIAGDAAFVPTNDIERARHRRRRRERGLEE